MGTSWRVDLIVEDKASLPTIDRQCRMALDRIVSEMSQWEPDSDLSKFNRLPAGASVTLPLDFAHVVSQALEIAEFTDGAFDPTVGAASELWGFGARPFAGRPGAQELKAAQHSIGWRRLSFNPQAKRLRQTGGVRLDLSAIAKGHAVDLVAQTLGNAGIRSYLVEIGGELCAHGVKPDGQPWWVGLAPEAEVAGRPPLRVALSGWAIATSANAIRYRQLDGRRLGHTLSPSTAMPHDNSAQSVTVLDTCAARADALATALMVMGEDGLAFARKNDIPMLMVLPSRTGMTEVLSPALQAML